MVKRGGNYLWKPIAWQNMLISLFCKFMYTIVTCFNQLSKAELIAKYLHLNIFPLNLHGNADLLPASYK
jgi:hypothetical protein